MKSHLRHLLEILKGHLLKKLKGASKRNEGLETFPTVSRITRLVHEKGSGPYHQGGGLVCRTNFGHKSTTRYSNKEEHESGCLTKDYL